MTRRATLKDVAGLAGVSTATVARVLHDNGYVAASTRRRVEAAVADTGYRINEIAQGLRRQRTATIGHLLNGVIPNPFFAGVALGVEQESLRHGCGVLLFNTNGDAEQERLGVETLIRRRVDGILFTTATHEDNVRLALAAGIPVVQVERMTNAETPAVTIDNLVGARAAVEHLVGLGHRHIAYIGATPRAAQHRPGSATWPDVEEERLDGYRNAMRDHGLPVDDNLIALGRYYTAEGRERPNDGYVAMRRFLQQANPPAAVFATSDLLAAGALQAIYERSLRVPDDISVVGFDDTYAPYFAPPLTTVEQPMVEIGQAAARLVFQCLSDPDAPNGARIVRLSTRLIVRASTGPPPTAPALAARTFRRHD
jgi:LacI family transcriptional regulator, galactose operon repressor